MWKIKLISILAAHALIYQIAFSHSHNLQADAETQKDKQKLRETISFLTSDALQGRDTGSPAEEMTVAYLTSQFQSMGLKPYWNSSFVDTFPLNYAKTQVNEINFGSVDLISPNDILIFYNGPEQEISLNENEIIFVGFGITAPEWDWDDFKTISIKDKIIIVRANDLEMEKENPFQNNRMGTYGESKHKMEEALRRGAKGVVLLHSARTVLDTSWQIYADNFRNEEYTLPYSLSHNAEKLQYRIQLPENKFKEILEKNGLNLESLYQASFSKDFQPQSLKLNLNISGVKNTNIINAHNIAALLPGESEKTIVLTAHIDHVGSRYDQSTKMTKVFPGAIDNASSVAAMLVVADKLSKQKTRMKYSVLFLGITGEEKGLLGSEYFVAHANPANILANINFDITPVWEKSTSIMAIAGEYSELGDMVQHIAQQNELDYISTPSFVKDILYRSDHFNFLRRKIPAIWVMTGPNFISGQNHFENYMMNIYHTTEDVYSPDWDYGSTLQVIDTTVELIKTLNTVDTVRMKDILPIK